MRCVSRLVLLAVFTAQAPPLQAETPDAVPTQAETAEVALTADNIYVDEANDTITAEGRVEAQYQGRTLRADRLIYNRRAETVRASGNVVIIDPDGTQRFSDEIETDTTLSDGYAIGFSTRLPNGGIAIAESAVRTSDGLNALDKIVYTSCELCEGETTPTWTLRARRAVLDENDQMYSYRDAVLEIAGVPVFYLPYFAHPDPDSDRRSGYLAPDFGTSSKLGVFYQQPYYWAISPSQDLTVAPKLMANVNPLLEFEHRKRFWSGQLISNFSFTNEQDFDADGMKFGEQEWRGHLFAQGRFDLTQAWLWGFGVEQVSDDLYTRRYDIEGENERRGLYSGQPLRLVNQLYVQGQDRNWYADASLIQLEGLRENDNDDTFPSVLPLIFAERAYDFKGYGRLDLTASTAYLTREAGIDSQRASLGADWSSRMVSAGGVILDPFLEARYDYYTLDEAPSGEDSVGRGVYSAGARISYPLYRPGAGVDILIEPIAMAAFGDSTPNDEGIPVEDSVLYEFDESTLFEASAVGGFDQYEAGNRASVGLSTTARWRNGVSLSAIGGKRWRSQTDPAFNEFSNLNSQSSDWVGSLIADFGQPLQFETRLRFDEDDFSINRLDAQISFDWWRLEGDVRYYRISKDITDNDLDDEGVTMEGQVQLTDEFYFVYARRRDISGRIIGDERQSGRDLRHIFGLAFEDDCSRFEVTFERSEAIDRTLGPNDALKFRFSLKTLGDFGNDER
ncbi:MAG: LPS assembly protein LptD [Pseudomonadota bacterium]